MKTGGSDLFHSLSPNLPCSLPPSPGAIRCPSFLGIIFVSESLSPGGGTSLTFFPEQSYCVQQAPSQGAAPHKVPGSGDWLRKPHQAPGNQPAGTATLFSSGEISPLYMCVLPASFFPSFRFTLPAACSPPSSVPTSTKTKSTIKNLESNFTFKNVISFVAF